MYIDVMRPSPLLSQPSSGPLSRNERVRCTDASGERLRIMTPKSDSGGAVAKGLPLSHSLSLSLSRARARPIPHLVPHTSLP